jgi:hypothetical protein
MTSSVKPIIDKSKLLTLVKKVNKTKLINKNNNNNKSKPFKLHRRTSTQLIFNDIFFLRNK